MAVHINEQDQYFNIWSPKSLSPYWGNLLPSTKGFPLSLFPPNWLNCLFSIHCDQLEQMFLLLRPFCWKRKIIFFAVKELKRMNRFPCLSQQTQIVKHRTKIYLYFASEFCLQPTKTGCKVKEDFAGLELEKQIIFCRTLCARVYPYLLFFSISLANDFWCVIKFFFFFFFV